MGHRSSHIANFKISEPSEDFLNYVKNYKPEIPKTEETNGWY
jgi:hypothetical protein